jgi:cation-transporting ATPase E
MEPVTAADRRTAPARARVQAHPTRGLTDAEAGRRRSDAGRPRRSAPSRSYPSIVRANVLTLFNAILTAFGVVTLIFGDWRDALFLGIVVANSAIGIAQEVRAKRALDRLAVLVAPHATVVRDGTARPVAPEELVPGDLVTLAAGDQIVADGQIAETSGLCVDESILTGESEAVQYGAGERLRSGAFVTEGSALMTVEAVGEASYAQRLAGEARSFRHPRSPLEREINALLLALTTAVVVLGAVLGYSLWAREATAHEAVATATAGVVSLVPEGLMLLTSLVFAVGAVRMARRGALAQQLNAIESLASADIVCLDKTGTLTEDELRVVDVVPRGGVARHAAEAAIAVFAATARARNRTLQAIATAFPGGAGQAIREIPFSARRGWSAVELHDATLVLGAPELFELGDLTGRLDSELQAGRRVVALGELEAALGDGPPSGPPPRPPRAICLVVLAEALRQDAAAAVAFFRSEGVELKVLSGDAPKTVAAIARDTGIEVGSALDGRTLPDDPERLREIALEATVVGRISPEDKRRVVEALRDAGRYVVMIGDGVNDVPALKASRLAIAQGSGADIAKSVSDVVLTSGGFAALPAMVAEGRQILRNIGRVARLYVTKSAFAAFLILTIGTTPTAYPLLPRHFSLAATLTVGIPTFLLALAPSSGRWDLGDFRKRVARFAVPAGVMAGVGVVASYLFALHALDFGVRDSRAIATTVLVTTGLYLVLVLEGVGADAACSCRRAARSSARRTRSCSRFRLRATSSTSRS